MMSDETTPEKPLPPESNPEATPADEPVESSMELAPGWWEVLLDEMGRFPKEEVTPSQLEQLMAAEEEPQFNIEEELGSFAFNEEQIPEFVVGFGARIADDCRQRAAPHAAT